MGSGFAQSVCIPDVRFDTDIKELFDQGTVILLPEVQKELAVAAEAGRQGHRPLVGATHDEDPVAEFALENGYGLENLRQRLLFLWIGQAERVYVLQGFQHRVDDQGRCVVRVLHSAAHGLGECRGPVFHKQHVVFENAPGEDLGFGEQVAALHAFGERDTGRPGGHQKIVEVGRHPVGDPARNDGHDPLQ